MTNFAPCGGAATSADRLRAVACLILDEKSGVPVSLPTKNGHSVAAVLFPDGFPPAWDQNEAMGQADSVSVLPQEHGVVSRQGNVVTYTPLYRSAIYERASERAWFTFPAVPADIKNFTVTAISGEGKQKEKEVSNPLK